jgi:ribose-phosphate pyrophosphokinase
MRLFALDATRKLGDKVAAALGAGLDPHEERAFEDGEHKARPLVSVRGQDCYVIQSLYGGPDQSADDKICRLLFFLATLRDNGAARVTAVVPYLAYSRKDRQTKTRDPITTRYMAQLLESMGTDAVVTLEVHNIVAFQNAFRRPTVHLDTRRLFASRVMELAGAAPLAVASPDAGGVKRAQLFREYLERETGREIGAAFMEKRRSAGKVSGTMLVGDVDGATVVIVDDLISTGGTILRAAEACLAHGAREVLAVAAHGLFTGEAAAVLRDERLSRILDTDTLPPFRLPADLAAERLEIVSAAPLLAGAIKCLSDGGSIAALLGDVKP